MKQFNGKILYNPKGKAAEYGKWAANTHIGCPHDCSYCYCKKGVLGSVMGGVDVKLKKPLVKFDSEIENNNYAIEVFKQELLKNIEQVKSDGGVFFSFTTDPLLKEVEYVTWVMVMFCNDNNVPVKILTKRADWVEQYLEFIENSNSDNKNREWRKLIAFGFTLTGHDELEPGASSNQKRIEAMRLLHDAGFRTFASIEPIIDFESSLLMIEQTLGFCELYKIGLMSGKNDYVKERLNFFVGRACYLISKTETAKVYWKESVKKLFGKIECSRGVTRDYNLFKNV